MPQQPGKLLILGLDADKKTKPLELLQSGAALLYKGDEIYASSQLLKKLIGISKPAARLLPLEFPVEKLARSIQEKLRKGRRLLLLADGDPLFHGIAGSLLKFMDKDQIEIIPAISSIQTACARIGLPWAELACYSLHAQSDYFPLLQAALGKKAFAVIFGNGPGPDAVCRLLLDRGRPAWKAHIFERLGEETEKTGTFSLEEGAASRFGSCALMILEALQKEKQATRLFLKKYASSEPATALVCSLLEPEPDNTIWDIGSGSGSVAFALARASRGARIFAIEKEASRALDIQFNRTAGGHATVMPVLGEAPGCLEDLPLPTKIFIGGGLSGERAVELLDFCASCLMPGATIVISCILLETLELCRKFFNRLGWENKIWHLQAAESMRLGRGEHLRPLNPVFIFHARKPLNAAGADDEKRQEGT